MQGLKKFWCIVRIYSSYGLYLFEFPGQQKFFVLKTIYHQTPIAAVPFQSNTVVALKCLFELSCETGEKMRERKQRVEEKKKKEISNKRKQLKDVDDERD